LGKERILTNLLFAPLAPNLDNPFRKTRFAFFRKLVDEILAEHRHCRILDIGGEADYWQVYAQDIMADPRVSISLLNVSFPDANDDSPADCKFARIVGDARCLEGIANKSYDIAHSNSVIEHVGNWTDMRAMGEQVHRVARVHYIQTPYWGFPVDPHNRTPFFHWLPEQFRYRLVLSRDLGFWSRANNVDEAMRKVQSSYLLDRRQFAALFPTSSIYSEIVYGVTKSLIAVGKDGTKTHAGSNTRRLRI
jgi:hypothetical protein